MQTGGLAAVGATVPMEDSFDHGQRVLVSSLAMPDLKRIFDMSCPLSALAISAFETKYSMRALVYMCVRVCVPAVLRCCFKLRFSSLPGSLPNQAQKQSSGGLHGNGASEDLLEINWAQLANGER